MKPTICFLRTELYYKTWTRLSAWTLANSAVPDVWASDLGLYCLLKLKIRKLKVKRNSLKSPFRTIQRQSIQPTFKDNRPPVLSVLWFIYVSVIVTVPLCLFIDFFFLNVFFFWCLLKGCASWTWHFLSTFMNISDVCSCLLSREVMAIKICSAAGLSMLYSLVMTFDECWVRRGDPINLSIPSSHRNRKNPPFPWSIIVSIFLKYRNTSVSTY